MKSIYKSIFYLNGWTKDKCKERFRLPTIHELSFIKLNTALHLGIQL